MGFLNRLFDRAYDALPSGKIFGKRVTKNFTRDALTFGAGGTIGKLVGGAIGAPLGPLGSLAGSVIGSGIASSFIGKAFDKAADRQRNGTDQRLNGRPDYDSFSLSDSEYIDRSTGRDFAWGAGLQGLSSLVPMLSGGSGNFGFGGGGFGNNFDSTFSNGFFANSANNGFAFA